MKKFIRWSGVLLTASLAVSPLMAQRPLGIDVSDIQGSGINWSSVKAAGYTFAWAKATEGTGYIASSFVPNENNAKAAGVYIGAYDFARPDLVTPTAEAAYFWAEAGPYIKNDGLTFMPMLDYETFQGLVGASTYASWANTWCHTVVNDAGLNGVVIVPFLYTTTCESCNMDNTMSQWIPDIANPSGESAQTGSPWDYTSCGGCNWWGNWNAWQYDWHGVVNGVPGQVDRDVFNGTATQLASADVAPHHISPCVATTSDGRLNLFAVGNTGFLYENYQTAPSGGWSGWIALGTSGNVWSPDCIPTVGTNADGRLELFIVGTDGSVNHIFQKTPGSSATSNWSGFSILNSSDVSQTVKFAIGNWSNGSLDLFVVGTDGVLYHDYQTAPNGGWSGFTSLGGSWSQDVDISVGRDLNGELDIFLIGSTGNLYNNWQTSVNGTSWHGWNDLTGLISDNSHTAVGRNSDGRLEIFVIGTDGVAYHNWETVANGQTSWNGWASFGGSWEYNSKPLVAADQNGYLEVFLIGNTGNMYHQYQSSSGWSGWVNLGGSFSQNIRPCIGTNKNGILELFLNYVNGSMEHAWETSANSTTWTSWNSLGGTWQ